MEELLVFAIIHSRPSPHASTKRCGSLAPASSAVHSILQELSGRCLEDSQYAEQMLAQGSGMVAMPNASE